MPLAPLRLILASVTVGSICLTSVISKSWNSEKLVVVKVTEVTSLKSVRLLKVTMVSVVTT